MKFYCWRANGDFNQVDSRSHETNSPAEAAMLELSFTAMKQYAAGLREGDLLHVWVQWLDEHVGLPEERIALVACVYRGPDPTLPLSYGAMVHFTTRLRWIEDADAWHAEMTR